jgi:hypothetical protein
MTGVVFFQTITKRYLLMNRTATFLLLGFFITVQSVVGQQAGQPKKAIICLTYDDGLESHLATVIPQLDSAKLKGTFFLNAIQGASNVIGQASPAVTGWRSAALKGHELANHTLFHPCPEKLGWIKEVSIESYTIDQIVKEIETQNALLALLDPSRKYRSFAFPCNNTFIGNTDYSVIIKEKGLVKFGRTGGDRNSIITDFKNLNTMQVPSWLVEEGTTAKELIAFAEKVKQSGGMGVYQFHGIGGQFFKVSREEHKAFLDYLSKNQADYQVITFSAAMEHNLAIP